MCGIAGATNEGEQLAWEMLRRIKHRGPDGEGVVTHGIAAHGHVRLSLVDLSDASAQPFIRNGSTLTFNGEIWNYRELRAKLQAEGATFATSGDTEVLSAALERDGLDCLNAIDGMFAFAWSSKGGEHWLVRDSFGKVPIYLVKTRSGFAWASERKAFVGKKKPIAVPPGFAFNLKTGKWLQWYKLPEAESLTPSKVEGLLREGVHKRLQADAAVCCLISGGLDSTAVLSIAKELRNDVIAFTATFDSASSDAQAARKVCKSLSVPLIEVNVQLTDKTIDEAIQAIEIPSKAQIEIAAMCIPLAKRIYAEGFRACLSGEAADELFGGYGNFCIQASRETDAGVVRLRKALVAKMSRGNFVRCNKAFMACGVECRLPFMEQRLVESAIQMGKAASPPGKKLLKTACAGFVPGWVINRPKDTFQGGSGIAEAIAKSIKSPVRFYNAQEIGRAHV